MAAKLRQEEIVTLCVLRQRGLSFRKIAATLGVCEGTVRYHSRRQGRQDGRRGKPRKAQPLAEAIDAWARQQPDGAAEGRPVNVLALYDWLRAEHAYTGSYR